MSDIALPRVHARRRKIKPPGPSFWRALAFVMWDLAFTVFDLFVAAPDGNSVEPWLGITCAGIMVTCLVVFDWPRFRRELSKWKADQ